MATDEETSKLTAVCKGDVVVWVPFPLPNNDACTQGVTCPTKSGSKYTFKTQLPIRNEYPAVSTIFGLPSIVDHSKHDPAKIERSETVSLSVNSCRHFTLCRFVWWFRWNSKMIRVKMPSASDSQLKSARFNQWCNQQGAAMSLIRLDMFLYQSLIKNDGNQSNPDI